MPSAASPATVPSRASTARPSRGEGWAGRGEIFVGVRREGVGGCLRAEGRDGTVGFGGGSGSITRARAEG